uniref:K Homology domain-containing protein n=1 Tax=Rhodnius prolixus TaxID=13249 RepID=T1HTB0_RHOPR
MDIREEYMVRVLIPLTTVEIITSNGGQYIASFAWTNNVKIKILPNEQQYPETGEAMCQIVGELANVIAAINVIAVMTSNDQYLDAERRQEIKIIIDNTEAGRIIGKGGSNLRTIMHYSGSKVRVSAKRNTVCFKNRCITIKGNQASNNNACRILLTLMTDLKNNYDAPLSRSMVEVKLNFYSPIDVEVQATDILTYFIPEILLHCGYTQEAITEILPALNVLSGYGLLSIGMIDDSDTFSANDEEGKLPLLESVVTKDDFRIIHSRVRIW